MSPHKIIIFLSIPILAIGVFFILNTEPKIDNCIISNGQIRQADISQTPCQLTQDATLSKTNASSTTMIIQTKIQKDEFKLISTSSNISISTSPNFMHLIFDARGTDEASNEIISNVLRITSKPAVISSFVKHTHNYSPADIEPYETNSAISSWTSDNQYTLTKSQTIWWDGIAKDSKIELTEKIITINE